MMELIPGGFADLRFFEQANRDLVQALARDSDTDIPARVTAVGTLTLRDTAAVESPWDTGTLSQAHRGRVEAIPYGATGTVDIDEMAVNPVYGGYPADYGQDLADPWLERTVQLVGDDVLTAGAALFMQLIDEQWSQT